MKREICFDTETTGFDPKEGDKLVEIGCVELIDGRITDRQCHLYINPEREVPQEAVDVHGLTTEFLSDKPTFREVAKDFLDFIGDDGILVAHNAQFDMKFINFELELMGLKPVKNKVVDSLAIAKNKFPGQKNNLDVLCKRFGVDSSKRVKHGALLDAELLADVYIELLGGAQDRMFENSSNNDKGLSDAELFAKILEEIKDRSILEVRDFKYNNDEFKAHKEFIVKNIKESLWEYIT
jgi:DNA polymerase-3 subunit epsilon